MPDATPHSARWVQSPDDIPELAQQIMDPARTKLVVGVTTQPSRERPLVDADALAARLGDQADVWVLTDPGHAWELTETLPPKIDVYGGAVRAWNPIAEGKEPYPSDHPQWTVFGPEDAERVVEQVVEYASLADNPPPQFGSVVRGKVTGVRKAGAEIELDSGHPAFASISHLVQHGEVFHAGDVCTVGQDVQVRVGAWHPQAARVSVSMRDFAPDPWERVDEVYGPGDIIEVGVMSIAPFGAFVELLPGVEGLLHKSKIADAFVEYVDDFVRPGDRITVRLLSLDVYDHKAEVSLMDVDPDEEPVPPASIFPGGPPWLPDADKLAAVQSEAAEDRVAQAGKAAVAAFEKTLKELGADQPETDDYAGRLRDAIAELTAATAFVGEGSENDHAPADGIEWTPDPKAAADAEPSSDAEPTSDIDAEVNSEPIAAAEPVADAEPASPASPAGPAAETGADADALTDTAPAADTATGGEAELTGEPEPTGNAE